MTLPQRFFSKSATSSEQFKFAFGSHELWARLYPCHFKKYSGYNAQTIIIVCRWVFSAKFSRFCMVLLNSPDDSWIVFATLFPQHNHPNHLNRPNPSSLSIFSVYSVLFIVFYFIFTKRFEMNQFTTTSIDTISILFNLVHKMPWNRAKKSDSCQLQRL